MTSTLRSSTSMKCVVVGDSSVGKTSLLMTYATNKFPEDHVMTVFDNYMAVTKYNNNLVRLDLWDTAGHEEMNKLRPLSYPQTDVFLLCFSLDNTDSFEHLNGFNSHVNVNAWISEIRQHCPNTPVILVGTKSDRRDELEQRRRENPSCGLRFVKSVDATAVGKQIGAMKYMECSAKVGTNVKEVFDTAIQAVLDPESLLEKKKRKMLGCRLF